jgi:small-conductance mechanosensitive channel
VRTLLADPRLRDVLLSVATLLGSLLAARAFSYLAARAVQRLTRGTGTPTDERMVAALQRPIAYAVILAGAWVAVHNLPVQARWIDRLDDVLFMLGVLLATLALIRAWGLLMGWYATESRHAAPDGLAREFGPLFSKLGVSFILVLAVIGLLHHFGVNVASLVVSLGVGSLALGLAAQDTLSNMFAGFTLMADRPFRVGDRIRLASGEVGDVQEIGMRATLIRTPDETMLVVPNSALIKERVLNLSRPTRGLTTRVDVSVAHGTDLARARSILAEAARESQFTDDEREPVVLVTRLADTGVNLQLVFWVRDYAEQGLAQSEVHEHIERRFREAGVRMPSPVQRIVLEGEPAAAARRAREV